MNDNYDDEYIPNPPVEELTGGLMAPEPAAFVTMLARLCDWIAEGGTLADFAHKMDLSAKWMRGWLADESFRQKAYDEAVANRRQQMADQMLREAHQLALSPLPEYNEDGRRVGGIDARDKLKAIELVGREVGSVGTDRRTVTVDGTITIGPILDRARQRIAKRSMGQILDSGTNRQGGGGIYDGSRSNPPPSQKSVYSAQSTPINSVIIDATE